MTDPNGTIPAPLKPPAAWFRDLPDTFVAPPEGPLVQIDLETGRVAALVAPYGECILDGRSGCWTPGMSKTNYEYAHVGAIVTAEGETIRTANVGGGINHFDTSLATAASLAADHYANSATRRMIGRYVDVPDVGIMFLGSMYPGSTYMHAFEAMTSALSGDWRWIESLRDHEMVGAQLVNNPGFRPNPLRNRPMIAAVAFKSTGAKVAAATGCSDAATIISEWEPIESPATPLVGRFATLEAVTASLMLGAVEDRPMLPSNPVDIMDLDDDGDEGEDWLDELADLIGDECRFCRGVGCKKCEWLGYTGPDSEAMVASLRSAEAIVAKLMKRPDKARDGDGDGFVYDSTPRQRPVIPGFDIIGENVDVDTLKRAAAGDSAARKKVRDRAAENYTKAAKAGTPPSVQDLAQATLGDRPKDRSGQQAWDTMSRDVASVHSVRARTTPTNDDPDRIPGGKNPIAGRRPRTPSEVAVDRASKAEARRSRGGADLPTVPAAKPKLTQPVDKAKNPALRRKPPAAPPERAVDQPRADGKIGRGNLPAANIPDDMTPVPEVKREGSNVTEVPDRPRRKGNVTVRPAPARSEPSEDRKIKLASRKGPVPDGVPEDITPVPEVGREGANPVGRKAVPARRPGVVRRAVDALNAPVTAPDEERNSRSPIVKRPGDVAPEQRPALPDRAETPPAPDTPAGGDTPFLDQIEALAERRQAMNPLARTLDRLLNDPLGADPDITGRNSSAPGEVSPTPSVSDFDPKVERHALARATALHAAAVAAEPGITELLRETTGDAGGRLHKEEFKFKGIGSVEGEGKGIAGKLLRKVRDKHLPKTTESIDKAKIGDALRYTAVLPDENYAEGLADILGELEKAGHTVTEVDNYWARGDAYSGINVEVVGPDGTMWELQIHTEASVGVVDEIHDLYDFARNGKKLADDSYEVRRDLRMEANALMTKRWEDIPQPPGWGTVIAELPVAGETIGVAEVRLTPAGLEGWQPATEFGLTYDPEARQLISALDDMNNGGRIDWSTAESTVIQPDDIRYIHTDESFLDGDLVEKVAGGTIPFKEDYPVQLYRDPNGELFIVDGNTRLAMYLGADRPMDVVIYDGPVDGMAGYSPKTPEVLAIPEAQVTVPGRSDSKMADLATRLSARVPRLGEMPQQRAGREWAARRGISLTDDSAIAPEARAEMEARAVDLPSNPAERYDALAEVFDGGIGNPLKPKAIHNNLGPNGDRYRAGRSAIHREMIAELIEQLEESGIPQDRLVVFTGGLPGAGKSFSLTEDGAAGSLGIVTWDPDLGPPPQGATHIAVSADYFKRRLAQLGLGPGIKGLKPMEEAELTHGESQDIARRFEFELARRGYNVAIDGTMRNEGQVRSQMDMFDAYGYSKPDIVFTDITAEESADSAAARFAKEALANPDMGGRYVPPNASAGASSRLGFDSVARDTVEYLVADGKSVGRVLVVNNAGVSNANTETLADVDPSYPLPAFTADRLRGNMSEADWRGALAARGIMLAPRRQQVAARAEGGKWTVVSDAKFTAEDRGPAGFLKRPVDKVAGMAGVNGGSGTKEDPFQIDDVNTAAVLLIEGEHYIELDSPKEVSALLDEVRDLVKEAKAAGRKPGNYDLCKVMVPGTNLFCAETKGYPRVKMPQLSTDKPVPGSYADSLPRSQWGDVNLVPDFLDWVRSLGIETQDVDTEAQDLKATQAQLLGSKIIRNYDDRKRELAVDPASVGRRIIVTRDGYIVDGHHGWAGNVAASYTEEGPVMQAVTVIDADILDILPLTNTWAAANGSPPQDITGSAAPPAPAAPGSAPQTTPVNPGVVLPAGVGMGAPAAPAPAGI